MVNASDTPAAKASVQKKYHELNFPICVIDHEGLSHQNSCHKIEMETYTTEQYLNTAVILHLRMHNKTNDETATLIQTNKSKECISLCNKMSEKSLDKAEQYARILKLVQENKLLEIQLKASQTSDLRDPDTDN